MGNAIAGGRRRTARVMTVDGTTYKYRPPASAAAALRDLGRGPGFHLLESDDVRRLGLRARPLDPDSPLKPGKLYFLVHLPRLAGGGGRVPRRTWSGQLVGGGAGERLESMMLSRRSASDVAAMVNSSPAAKGVEIAGGEGGGVRLRVRLPKAEVARLVKESRDAGEAAEKIMQLCVERDRCLSAPATPVLRPPMQLPPAALVSAEKKKKKGTEKNQDLQPPKLRGASLVLFRILAVEFQGIRMKKARFVTDVPDEIIGF
uniref:Uncharacterized protein n=1 Tax=Leersia perrieri TaxID=77586 RepID=A0A0D9X823_9ORYZ